jgi:hypothetical protein
MSIMWGATGSMIPTSPTESSQHLLPKYISPAPATLTVINSGGSKVGFRGTTIAKIIKKLGYPSLTDPTHGGIAIWKSSILKKAGYAFLNKVEVIDEKITSMIPVPHVSSVYIWVKIPLLQSQMMRVLELSPNLMYDQYKKLLIVRSKCIESAIGIAALIGLYANDKVTMYQINNYDLLRKYFTGASQKKNLKLFKSILKRHG